MNLTSAAADIAHLREEALSVIQRNRGVEKLREILKESGDPRLLVAPASKNELFRGSLLDAAIVKGAVDEARVLLESGADPMHAAGGDGFGATHALGLFAHQLIDRSIQSFMEMLAAAGANFDTKDEKGFAPLHYAVASGSVTLVQLLVEQGVSIDPNLLNDPTLEATITPSEGNSLRPRVIEALRLVRAMATELNLLSAMPAELEPERSAKPSPGMTL